MIARPFDYADGKRRKRMAHATLAEHREIYIRRGRRALLMAMLSNVDGTAIADDVREAVPIPSNVSPKLFGAVPSALVEARIIRADGYRNSSRPNAHSRPVTIWRLIDPEAAHEWLAGNPDEPDVDDPFPLFANLSDK